MSTLALDLDVTTATPASSPAKQTCATCRHWRQLGAGHSARAGAAGFVGACHALPPGRDFAWPRTKDADCCGSWENPTTTATPAAAKPGRAKIRTPNAEK